MGMSLALIWGPVKGTKSRDGLVPSWLCGRTKIWGAGHPSKLTPVHLRLVTALDDLPSVDLAPSPMYKRQGHHFAGTPCL